MSVLSLILMIVCTIVLVALAGIGVVCFGGICYEELKELHLFSGKHLMHP